MTKWVVKEFDNVEVPDRDVGVFYSSEAYVIRWGFRITVSTRSELHIHLHLCASMTL